MVLLVTSTEMFGPWMNDGTSFDRQLPSRKVHSFDRRDLCSLARSVGK